MDQARFADQVKGLKQQPRAGADVLAHIKAPWSKEPRAYGPPRYGAFGMKSRSEIPALIESE